MEESEKPNTSDTAYRHFIYSSCVAVAVFIQNVFIYLFPDISAKLWDDLDLQNVALTSKT